MKGKGRKMNKYTHKAQQKSVDAIENNEEELHVEAHTYNQEARGLATSLRPSWST